MSLDQIKTWTEVSANLVTSVGIIFGIIGAIYVSRQWRLAHSEWRFKRYDTLFTVYRANLDFINAVLGGRCSNQLLIDYAQNVMSREFLVGPKIRSFHDELYSQSSILLTCDSMVEGERDLSVVTNLQKKRGDVLQWFVLQPARAKELFHKHLNIED